MMKGKKSGKRLAGSTPFDAIQATQASATAAPHPSTSASRAVTSAGSQQQQQAKGVKNENLGVAQYFSKPKTTAIKINAPARKANPNVVGKTAAQQRASADQTCKEYDETAENASASIAQDSAKSPASSLRCITGYVTRLCYHNNRGEAVVEFKRKRPETILGTTKKKSTKKTKKTKSSEDEEDEDDDGGIDLQGLSDEDADDDEDDDEEEGDGEEEEDGDYDESKQTKHGYSTADNFIVSDSDCDAGGDSSSGSSSSSSSSESSSGSEDEAGKPDAKSDGEAGDEDEEGDVESEWKPKSKSKKSEDTVPSPKTEGVTETKQQEDAGEPQTERKRPHDEAVTSSSSTVTPTTTESPKSADKEESSSSSESSSGEEEEEPQPKRRKIDFDIKVPSALGDLSSLVTVDVKKPTKAKELLQEDKEEDEDMGDASEESNHSHADEEGGADKQPQPHQQQQQPPKKAAKKQSEYPDEDIKEAEAEDGKIYKIRGMFPVISAFVFMKIIIADDGDGQQHRCVRVLEVTRVWKNELTRKKIVELNTKLEVVDMPSAALTKALQPLGGKMTDPIKSNAVYQLSDTRLTNLLGGALYTEEDMAISELYGYRTYDIICKRGGYRDELRTAYRSNIISLLFAEIMLPHIVQYHNLESLRFEDFERVANFALIQEDKEMLRMASKLYKYALYALKEYGDTLVLLRLATKPSDDPVLVEQAMAFLVEKKCFAKIPEKLCLRNVCVIEKTLSDRVMVLCSADPLPSELRGDCSKETRSELLQAASPDMAEALTMAETNALSMVVGPEETALYLLSLLTQLHPGSEITVGTFNSQSSYTVQHAYRLPQDSSIIERKLSNKGVVDFLVLMDVQYAGSVTLKSLLTSANPDTCRVVMVGDNMTLTPPPQAPDMGRPFVGMCEAQIPPRVFVASQAIKEGPEAVLEDILCSSNAAETLVNNTISVCMDDSTQQHLVIRTMDDFELESPQVIFVSTMADKAGLEKYTRGLPRNEFRLGELVAVKSNNVMVAAGTWIGVRTGFESMLVPGCKTITLPLQRTRQIAPGSGAFKTTHTTYVTADITVELDYSGRAGKHVDVKTNDVFFLERLTVASIRRTPPFVVDVAALRVTRMTTMADICAAAKVAHSKLVLIGSIADVLDAIKRKMPVCSFTGFMLSQAKLKPISE